MTFRKQINRLTAALLCGLLLASLLTTTALAMQIFVKLAVGEKTLTLEVEPGDKMDQIKEKIQEQEGIPPACQRLFYLGEELSGGLTLANYNIQKDSTLDLVIEYRTYFPLVATGAMP
jgi:hypothetical protein